ncbi:MAG: TonB family protein [Gammaproteobacteria bacterium]|nr:TonB family protein [Gammaproteobacteria bacterium]MCP4091585.1 TonB family protein [Gammaproteobacteria bacterium]MCP4276081.1 TonB family protein [Gammaproteobacteria bacterium]MCP4832573.1 TonB family protein [Gammaproteobacteria bacterium]MCP4929651.1 TonB family protein [Gammaproteobacteria bacterium]
MLAAISYAHKSQDLSPGQWRPRPDNFMTMLFLAILFHSILILGISFTADKKSSSSAQATSIEVILLTREHEKRPNSPDAKYIAQRNLVGSGNTTDDDELKVSYGRNANPVMPGPEQQGAEHEIQRAAKQSGAGKLLYAHTQDGELRANSEQKKKSEQRALHTSMPGTTNTLEILATPNMETVLKGTRPRQLVISANTRESRIAAYLDNWKRRVERVGTMNFPRKLLNQPETRDPVLQVSIAASGKLTEVIVLTGSGNQDLDMAAIDILRRAAPFDPFPEYLRNDYDALKFSYEWRFSGSGVERIRVP